MTLIPVLTPEADARLALRMVADLLESGMDDRHPLALMAAIVAAHQVATAALSEPRYQDYNTVPCCASDSPF